MRGRLPAPAADAVRAAAGARDIKHQTGACMRMEAAVILLVIVLGSVGAARADEGMWTYDNFPSAKMQARYGWAPDAAWLDHARLGEHSPRRWLLGEPGFSRGPGDDQPPLRPRVREPTSPTPSTTTSGIGFYAKTQADEKKCPQMEVNQLIDITDVTAQDRGRDRRQVRPRLQRRRTGGQGRSSRRACAHRRPTCAARS